MPMVARADPRTVFAPAEWTRLTSRSSLRGMWLVVHLVNVVSFRSRVVVLVNWAWDYLFYDRPVRLIVRARQ